MLENNRPISKSVGRMQIKARESLTIALRYTEEFGKRRSPLFQEETLMQDRTEQNKRRQWREKY